MATARTVYRDFSTDGVPSSGRHTPKKSDIRTLLTSYETIINTFTSSGGLVYLTRADLYADLAHDAKSMAWVVQDPDPAKNGIYQKVGASGAGAWARVADLPHGLLPASDVGAGTANAIQATTPSAVTETALVLLDVYRVNTGSPVTVSFNGGDPLTIKTATGGDIPAGALTPDMGVLGKVAGDTFRMLSDASYDAVMQERLAATTQAKSDALSAKTDAQNAAGDAGQSATDAATYAGAAATTLATVIASAEAGGQARIFDTKAAATAAISTIADQEVVEVLIDETSGGGRTRYRKQSGSLVFKLRLDETWDKLIEKIAETGEDIIGQALAELPAIATNRYTGRSLKDRFSDVVSIMDCGAVPGDDDAHAVANDLAFTKAISKLSHGSVLIIPDLGMPFVIGHMVSVNIGYVRIACFGKLKASASFTDPYMWSNDTSADGSESTWYRAPILVDMLNLDCAYKTRGLYQYKLDHQTLDSARVERAFGNAIYIDRMRESTIYSPTIIEAKARQRFSNPAQWLAGTTYAVGDRVRAVNAAWDSATAYPQGDIVEYGGGRYISRKASTNQAPGSDFASWQPIPFEDYECVISGTGKNPFTYNTNSSISGNRYWKKVYQDEAALEIVDSVQDNADRSNGNHIYTPVIRDCANMCLMRVDSNKSGPAFGPLSVHGGHIHDIVQGASSYPADLAGAETTPMRRVLEIGYAFAVAFYGTQLRASDANSSIVVLIGDGGATKSASFVSFLEGSISSGGSGAVGILIMPSVTNQSIKSTSRMLVGNGGTDALPILDPKSTMKDNVYQGRSVKIYPKASGNHYVDEYISPATFPVVSPISFKRDTNDFRSFLFEVLSDSVRLLFGSGASDLDTQLFRDVADRLTMGTGDSFRVDGTYNGGHFVMGNYHLWVDAEGRLRIKNGAPTPGTGDHEGTVIGSQT